MRSVDFEFEKGRGETKDLFESDFIGQINTRDPKYKETWDEMAKEELRKYELGEWKREDGPPAKNYLRLRKAMDLARKFQPGNPSLPQKPFARDIRLEVIKLFEEKVLKRKAKPEERMRFRFFTAADGSKEGGANHSPMDKFHGSNAWLEYSDENGYLSFATFALLLRGENRDPQGRNIIVRKSELPDPYIEGEADKYDLAMKKFAEQVFQKMFGPEDAKKIRE